MARHHRRTRLGGGFQLCNFLQCQRPESTWLDIQRERPIAHTPNLLDMMPDFLEHAADLPVAAFDQSNFIPGIRRVADQADLRGRCLDTLLLIRAERKSLAQASQFFFGRLAAHFYDVSLWDMR